MARTVGPWQYPFSWRFKKKKKREKNADSEKPLPTLIKEKEPIWYRVP
jgi:hypothetical protein